MQVERPVRPQSHEPGMALMISVPLPARTMRMAMHSPALKKFSDSKVLVSPVLSATRYRYTLSGFFAAIVAAAEVDGNIPGGRPSWNGFRCSSC